jgi:hypothetical protein
VRRQSVTAIKREEARQPMAALRCVAGCGNQPESGVENHSLRDDSPRGMAKEARELALNALTPSGSFRFLT